MNLLQVQDQLKSLPSDPRTMQALMAYANGANPAVPPYLALGELNRRKQLMEKAQMEQASQPPQGTVKDQVEQQAGIMALQAGRQQQAMQNAMRIGSAMPQGAPTGIPQPQPQQTVQAAGGGLMGLLSDRARAKRMNSGGIVALAEAGEVPDPDENEETEDGDVDTGGLTAAEAARQYAAQNATSARLVKALEAMQQKTPETRMAYRERMIKENPEEFGHLKEDDDKNVMTRLDELQAAKRAELDKQREEAQQTKPGILQLLGRAAMESRGQQGRSALASILGGYEKLSSGEEQKAVEREQALRAKDLEMQQGKMEVINKLRAAKVAKDEGRIEDAYKNVQEANKLAAQLGTTIANLVGKGVTAAGSLAGRMGAAETAAKAKVKAATASAARAAKDTDQTRGIAILEADIRAKNPEMSDVEVRAEALRQYRLGTPAGAAVAQRTTSDAMTALAKFKLMNSKEWKAYVENMGGDVAAASKAYVDDYKAGVLPPQLMPKSAAAPAPAPKASSTTPPSISSVKGAPAGSTIGKFVQGQGWEIRSKDDKLLGYAK